MILSSPIRKWAVTGLFLTYICFSGTLWFDFVFDDYHAVVSNKAITSNAEFGDYVQLLAYDFWGTPLSADTSHKSYRPLTSLVLKALYAGVGETPAIFHFVNVLLHFMNSVLVYRLAEMFTRKERTQHVAAILFCIHPVHIEAVASIVGLADLLSFFFAALCLLYHTEKHIIKCSTFLLFAILSKETAIILPPLLFISSFFRIDEEANEKSFSILNQLAVYLSVGYLFLKIKLTDPSVGFTDIFLGKISLGLENSQTLRAYENPFYFHQPDSVLLKIYSWLVVMNKNVELLVFPTALSAEYSFDCIKMVDSFDDKRVPFLKIEFYFLIVFILSKLLILAANWRKQVSQGSEAAFGLLWIIITMIPFSHVVITVATLVAERLLYIPSFGFCLLIAHYFTSATAYCNTKGREYFSWTVKIVEVLYFTYLLLFTYSRAEMWENDLKLSQASLNTCPDSVKISLYRVNSLLSAMHEDEPVSPQIWKQLQKVMELDPQFCDVSLTTARAYLRNNDIAKAYDFYFEAMECPFTTLKAQQSFQTLTTAIVENEKHSFYGLANEMLGKFSQKYGNNDTAFKAYTIALNTYLERDKNDNALDILAYLQPFMEFFSSKQSCQVRYTHAKLLLEKNIQGLSVYELLIMASDVNSCGTELDLSLPMNLLFAELAPKVQQILSGKYENDIFLPYYLRGLVNAYQFSKLNTLDTAIEYLNQAEAIMKICNLTKFQVECNTIFLAIQP